MCSSIMNTPAIIAIMSKTNLLPRTAHLSITGAPPVLHANNASVPNGDAQLVVAKY